MGPLRVPSGIVRFAVQYQNASKVIRFSSPVRSDESVKHGQFGDVDIIAVSDELVCHERAIVCALDVGRSGLVRTSVNVRLPESGCTYGNHGPELLRLTIR